MSVRVSSAVWELDLSPSAKLALLCLSKYADDEGGNCYPGIDRIARDTGLSRRTVQYQLRELEGFGLIETMEGAGGGRGNPASYRVRPERGALLPIEKGKKNGTGQLSAGPRQRILAALIAEGGPVCWMCGGEGDEQRGPDGESWHVDRILPGAKGGKYEDGNMALACARCNKTVGARRCETAQPLRPLPQENSATIAPIEGIKGAAFAPLEEERAQSTTRKGASNDTSDGEPLRRGRTVIEPSIRSAPLPPKEKPPVRETTTRPSRKKPETPLPDDFSLSEDDYRYAAEKGLSRWVVDFETERFRNHAQSHERKARDWKAAWRNWILKGVRDFDTADMPRMNRHAETQTRPDEIDAAIARIRVSTEPRYFGSEGIKRMKDDIAALEAQRGAT